jgi:hypothetical protein
LKSARKKEKKNEEKSSTRKQAIIALGKSVFTPKYLQMASTKISRTAGRKKLETPKKHRIGIRFSDTERNAIVESSAESQISLSSYIRNKVLGTPMPSILPIRVRQANKALIQQAGFLNMLARWMVEDEKSLWMVEKVKEQAQSVNESINRLRDDQ